MAKSSTKWLDTEESIFAQSKMLHAEVKERLVTELQVGFATEDFCQMCDHLSHALLLGTYELPCRSIQHLI